MDILLKKQILEATTLAHLFAHLSFDEKKEILEKIIEDDFFMDILENKCGTVDEFHSILECNYLDVVRGMVLRLEEKKVEERIENSELEPEEEYIFHDGQYWRNE